MYLSIKAFDTYEMLVIILQYSIVTSDKHIVSKDTEAAHFAEIKCHSQMSRVIFLRDDLMSDDVEVI
jgi:hypothetical protein